MASRATFVYIFMLAIFATGLWAIISFGSILLQAPEDLAGEWELYEPGTPIDAEPAARMSIDQSGRFFKIRLEEVVLDLTLVSQRQRFIRAFELITVDLADERSRATFRGVRRGDLYNVQISGVTIGQWQAKRLSRPYGPDHVPRYVTSPPPTTAPAPPRAAPTDARPTTLPTIPDARIF